MNVEHRASEQERFDKNRCLAHALSHVQPPFLTISSPYDQWGEVAKEFFPEDLIRQNDTFTITPVERNIQKKLDTYREIPLDTVRREVDDKRFRFTAKRKTLGNELVRLAQETGLNEGERFTWREDKTVSELEWQKRDDGYYLAIPDDFSVENRGTTVVNITTLARTAPSAKDCITDMFIEKGLKAVMDRVGNTAFEHEFGEYTDLFTHFFNMDSRARATEVKRLENFFQHMGGINNRFGRKAKDFITHLKKEDGLHIKNHFSHAATCPASSEKARDEASTGEIVFTRLAAIKIEPINETGTETLLENPMIYTDIALDKEVATVDRQEATAQFAERVKEITDPQRAVEILAECDSEIYQQFIRMNERLIEQPNLPRKTQFEVQFVDPLLIATALSGLTVPEYNRLFNRPTILKKAIAHPFGILGLKFARQHLHNSPDALFQEERIQDIEHFEKKLQIETAADANDVRIKAINKKLLMRTFLEKRGVPIEDIQVLAKSLGEDRMGSFDLAFHIWLLHKKGDIDITSDAFKEVVSFVFSRTGTEVIEQLKKLFLKNAS